MPKNIVICADGTGNTFHTNVSNVVRLVKALRLNDRTRQIVFYDQGVGTKERDIRVAKEFAESGGRPGLHILSPPKTPRALPSCLTRTLGLGFGFGLAKNVAEMYGALVSCYEDGDCLYLFGFSRGAFTVRVLAGILHRCGLLRPEHRDRFWRAFQLYDRHYEHIEKRDELEQLRARVDTFKSRFARDCHVHFMGLWDTVKSYGFIVPKSLPHLRHNASVKTVRHALALDERRCYFQATSWGGVDDPEYDDSRPCDSPDVTEAWFAGSHSDVGGGYKAGPSGLARPPFTWMVDEARPYGLEFDDRELECVRREFPPERMVHDSLKAWWWLCELLPRIELENIPRPGKRLVRWGSSGRRSMAHFSRGGAVYVHSSLRDAYAASGITLAGNRKVVTVGDATSECNAAGAAVCLPRSPGC